MNRIAGRAWIALVFVAIVCVGVLLFLGDYFANGADWVMFPGSPHVYSGGRLSSGMVLDRSGALLLDYSDGKTYAPDASLRRAMLHWLGDREGNIRGSAITEYTDSLVGFDPINGVYAYGEAQGRVQLTLSARVQLAALEALGDYKGTVGVYNYRTGELLCAVSTPGFDPDDVPDIAGDTTGAYDGAYMNRFIQSAYIPGSIFKIATLAAAVESVPDILEQRFTCTGVYEIGTGDVTCEGAHGEQSLQETFAHSCNCGFAQIVELIGREKLARCIAQFGLTDRIQFDGITTAAGNFDIADASGELLAWSGIGQHTDQINPCAFMTFVGAIASGGSGVTPHVVEEVRAGGSTTYRAEPEKRSRIMSKATAELVAAYMRNNVETVYGDENFPGMQVCAKTGTGQVGGEKKSNAMMAGFVADEKYPLAFIIAIEEGGYGGVTCRPVLSAVLAACKEILDQ